MTMQKLISAAITVLVLLLSFNASAAYNANMSGVVVALLTYTDADHIFLQLNNQPSAHPSCSPGYFVIASDVPADRRKALLAQLMVAKVTGEPINLGYDNAGDCAHGYIRVHRVG